jgi:hypothetical protein
MVIIVSNITYATYLDDIVSNHPARYATDLLYEKLFDNIVNQSQWPVQPITNDLPSLEQIELSAYNTEIYIADIIVSSINGTDPTYTTYQLHHYFILSLMYDAVKSAVDRCSDAFNPVDDWWDWLFPGADQPAEWMQCENAVQDLNNLWELYDVDIAAVVSSRDAIYQTGIYYLQNLAILCILDNTFYTNNHEWIDEYRGQLKAWTNVMKEWYGYNNIPMKAYSAIALYEAISGNKSTLPLLDAMIDMKFTQSGAYSEGTGYLDWLYQELATFYYMGRVFDQLDETDLNDRVLSSADWLISIADETV